MRNYLLALLYLSLCSFTFAKRFTSQFTEFELPNGWTCKLEGSEWVCQSENEERRKEAIIVLAAKKRGSEDTLAKYQEYLGKSKVIQTPGGISQTSEAKSVRKRKIDNHLWMESLHLASEIPGYYTRYLATVKSNLAIVVTFSVAKDHYSHYRNIFNKMIESLKVFSVKQQTSTFTKSKIVNKSKALPGDENDWEDLSKGSDISVSQNKSKNGQAPLSENLSFLFIIIAIVIAIIVIRKKRKNK